jgi:excinuclease UvrABC nuclease subunit
MKVVHEPLYNLKIKNSLFFVFLSITFRDYFPKISIVFRGVRKNFCKNGKNAPQLRLSLFTF